MKIQTKNTQMIIMVNDFQHVDAIIFVDYLLKHVM